jgi:hypothetical protein
MQQLFMANQFKQEYIRLPVATGPKEGQLHQQAKCRVRTRHITMPWEATLEYGKHQTQNRSAWSEFLDKEFNTAHRSVCPLANNRGCVNFGRLWRSNRTRIRLQPKSIPTRPSHQ